MSGRIAVVAVILATAACGGRANGDPCAVEVDERLGDVAGAFSSAPTVDLSSSVPLQIVAPSPLTTWRLEGSAAVISWRPRNEGRDAGERSRSLLERLVEGKRRFSGDAFAVTVRRDGARCPFVAVTPSRSLQLPENVIEMLGAGGGRTIEIKVDTAFFIDGKMSGRRQAPVVSRIVVDDGQREARSSAPPRSSHGEG